MSQIIICGKVIAQQRYTWNENEWPELRVVATSIPPFIVQPSECQLNATMCNGSQALDGFVIELLVFLSKTVRFRYTVTLNSLNGALDDVIEGRANLAIGPITPTRLRLLRLDFSQPFLITGLSVMMRKPQMMDFMFLKPQVLSLAALIFAAILIFSLGVALLRHILHYFPFQKRLLPIGILTKLQNARCEKKLFINQRLATITWWLFFAVMIAFFAANLLISLMNNEKQSVSVDELGNRNGIKVGVKNEMTPTPAVGMAYVEIQNTLVKTMKPLGFKITREKENHVKSYAEGIERVRQGGYAFILEATENDYVNNQLPCDTYRVGGLLNFISYHMALPIGSPWRKRIDTLLVECQAIGLLKQIENRWWKDKSECHFRTPGVSSYLKTFLQLFLMATFAATVLVLVELLLSFLAVNSKSRGVNSEPLNHVQC